ncbi:MAG: iron donor protein CyaY [Alphaproteobacteria bacterium]
MTESDFHHLAERWLLAAQDAIDLADEEGLLDADLAEGVLTIQTDNAQVFVVSKHAPSMQLWLSSPLSGGLHFSYDDVSGHWLLGDSRSLSELLMHELHVLTGVTVKF